tara:strand:- start:3274 stop:3630 length:357 start_codon:yes stop_codon:yes gene_type:complete
MSAMYNDIKIEFNLNELVAIRAGVLKLEMTEDDIDEVAMDARVRVTWDTLYGMIDDLILEYMDQPNPNKPNYGERSIETIEITMEKEKKEREKEFKKNFDMITLEGGSWTIEVPMRKK